MSFGANVNLAGQIFPITIGYVYDPIGMSYVPAQQAGGGTASSVNIPDGFDVAEGSKTDAAWDGVAASASVVSLLKKMAAGGGSAVSLADGADVAQGAKADSAWDLITGAPTIVAILKKAAGLLDSIRVSLAGTLVVTGPLTDTQLRATPLALPSGASTSVKQDTGNTSLGSIDTKLTGVALDGTDISGASMPAGGVGLRGWLSAIYTKLAASIAVTGTFWQATQPVSIAAAVAVTGVFFQATQPVSGTVAVSNLPATQPISAVALPLPANAAQETGGNLATLAAASAGQATTANQASEIAALALLDADLKAEVGVVGTIPGAYTVLDRLNVLAQKVDKAASTNAQDATLKQVLAALKPVPGQSAVRATLLHR